MVGNITSLTGNGLRDWLIQRVTAVVLGIYAIYMFAYFLLHPQLDYATWQQLFQCLPIRLFSVLALLSLVVHAWIGIWTIFTDYLQRVCIRVTMQVLVFLSLLVCLAWGIAILWGVQ